MPVTGQTVDGQLLRLVPRGMGKLKWYHEATALVFNRTGAFCFLPDIEITGGNKVCRVSK